VIELPPRVAEQLRAEMRDPMDTFDAGVGAVAFGEFDRAADIAETRTRMGHRLDERLRERGFGVTPIDRGERVSRGSTCSVRRRTARREPAATSTSTSRPTILASA
jgi:hypothetical protein